MYRKLWAVRFFIMGVFLLFGCSEPAEENNENKVVINSAPAGQKYFIDTTESIVAWKGSMLMGANSHTGYVYVSKGVLMIENGQLVGGTAEVDMQTIEDEAHGRDNGLVNHLKDPDFFDVKRFPVATMAITSSEPINKQEVKVTGNLTIRGVMQSVSFPAKTEINAGVAKVNGKLVIDRTQWGVNYQSGKFYGSLADKAISDDIELNIKITAKPQVDSASSTFLLDRKISEERKPGKM